MKTKWLWLGLCSALLLVAASPVLAGIQQIAWLWLAGVHDCGLWSAGCNAAGEAWLPAGADTQITLPVGDCPAGMVELTRAAAGPPITVTLRLNGAVVARQTLAESMSVSVGQIMTSTLAVENTSAVSATVYSLYVYCEDELPDIADLAPYPLTLQPTGFRHIKIFRAWDIYDMGRYALTILQFIDDSGYTKWVVYSLVILPLALTFMVRLMHKPPEV